MNRLVIGAGIVLLLAGGQSARAAANCASEKAVVDAAVRPYVYAGGAPSASRAPGMIVGVWLAGKPCYYGFGTTRLGEHDVPTAHTLWEMGSVTKTFTATMLALHQVAGTVNVNSRVNFARMP